MRKTIEQMDKEQLFDQLAEARRNVDEAGNALHSALTRLKSALLTAAVKELLIVPKAQRGERAIDHIRSNRAEWSGGPGSARNILERLTAESFVEAFNVTKNRE